MYLKLFMLRYIPEQSLFDEMPLQQFLRQYSCEVLEYQSSFYTIDGLPACAVLVAYRKKEESRMPNPAKSQAFVASSAVPQMMQAKANASAIAINPPKAATKASFIQIPSETKNANVVSQTPAGDSSPQKNKFKRNELPDLPPEDLPLWIALKNWRAEQARITGNPAYTYFLNEQIFSMIKARPKNLEELKRQCGLGHKRLENFGRDILKIIAQYPKEKPVVKNTTEQPVVAQPSLQQMVVANPVLPVVEQPSLQETKL